MEKARVTYRQAQDLKELGYNIPSDRYYLEGVETHSLPAEITMEMITSHKNLTVDDLLRDYNSIPDSPQISAPTLEEVRQWLEHEHHVMIDTHYSEISGTFRYNVEREDVIRAAASNIPTRNDALSAAIGVAIIGLKAKRS